jgi:hypothetical protein
MLAEFGVQTELRKSVGREGDADSFVEGRNSLGVQLYECSAEMGKTKWHVKVTGPISIAGNS